MFAMLKRRVTDAGLPPQAPQPPARLYVDCATLGWSQVVITDRPEGVVSSEAEVYVYRLEGRQRVTKRTTVEVGPLVREGDS